MSIHIIARILGLPTTSWTVKLAASCDYLGLLRSRMIRSWFGITENRLMDVQRELDSNSSISNRNATSITKEQ